MSEEGKHSDGADRSSFVLDSGFQAAEPSAGLGLGPLERQYQELFAEVLEDGVISLDERERLNKVASNLGLNHERLQRLEDAMTAAYESHHRIRVVNLAVVRNASLAPLVQAPPLSTPPAEPSLSQGEMEQLRKENAVLRERLSALELELERAQAHVNVEVDLSAFSPAISGELSVEELWKQVHQDPSNPDAHRTLMRAYESEVNLEGQYVCAQALCALKVAAPEQEALFERYRPQGLISPSSAIDQETWRRNLAHPEDDAWVGAIFSVVVPAVLVGRVTTLRRDGLLHTPTADKKQDPAKTTVMAVRALSWAAALMGLPVPGAYTEPEQDAGYAHVVGLPPVSVLGRKALSGRSITDLAFLVGQHMSGYRGDHYVKTLFSATEDLEDLFLAALIIANPKLPIKGAQRARIESLSRAIEPLLETQSLDALRTHYLGFAEAGGRTNLQRWSQGVEKTSARAGLVLCQNLPESLALLSSQEGEGGELSLDLLSYSTSQKFLDIRKKMGLSIPTS